MPIFDMRCNKCEYLEDDILIRGKNPVYCPKCGSLMEKLFTSTKIGFNAEKLKMDREHEVWCHSAKPQLSVREI